MFSKKYPSDIEGGSIYCYGIPRVLKKSRLYSCEPEEDFVFMPRFIKA